MSHRDPSDPTSSIRSQWTEMAEASLRGGQNLEGMRSRTEDGFELEVVYFPEDAPAGVEGEVPGDGSFLRGATSVRPLEAWDLRSPVAHADLETVNHRALAELAGGANSLEIAVRGSVRSGLSSQQGIDGPSQLNRALEDVYLDLAPLALDAGLHFEAAAHWAGEVLNRREHDPAFVSGAWNADPLGDSLLAGDPSALGEALDDHIAKAASLAVWSAETWPRFTSLRVGGLAVHAGGATDALELAYLASAAIEYLRAMERAELEMERAFDQILMETFLGADVFAGIAKLRALRVLWARVAEVCGVDLARGPRIQATTSPRMLARREPMVNVLRATSATAAAVLGGAEVITTLSYDAAVGDGSLRGRRLARNTQILLREEAFLDRVLDPAGGSWYLEARTQAVAERAWSHLQEIDGMGGAIEAIRTGALPQTIRDAAEARDERVAKRRPTLVGVSDFARLDDPEEHDSSGPVPPWRDGALEPISARPLDRRFEALRAASDGALAASGRRPSVWLANLGSLAQHNARSTFVRNALAAGGIAAAEGDGAVRPEGAAEAWLRESGRSSVAVLCSSDPVYLEWGAAAAAALREAGVEQVLLAGRVPRNGDGVGRTELEDAIDGTVALGMDLASFLEELHRSLGVSPVATEAGQ